MRLVFHPDYSYSDFVGQILPRASNGNIAYDFVEGPFTCILEKAQNNKDNPFFLIIEEINRGNAAAIFGDIFQLLDRYDDGIGKYSIKNADIAEKIFKDKNIEIRLPKNLWIFATMNTSDQNVFTLDTAFQRRFEMQLVENKFSDDPNKQGFEIEDTGVTWKIFAEAINDILAKQDAVVSSEDKSLGAWFVKPDKGSNAISKEKFANKVLKYLWDDAFKFARNEIFKVSEDKNTLQKVILAFKLGGFDGIFQDSIIQKIKLENN
jgi:5-methylcytosine-specific restriction endonuclease McrBC GTP-binding regulatory subunit McrB